MAVVVWLLALWGCSAAGLRNALDNPAGVPYVIVAAVAYAAMSGVLLWRWTPLTGAPLSALGFHRLGKRDIGAIAAGALVAFALRLCTFAYLAAIGQPGHVQAGLGAFRPEGPLSVALVILLGATIAPFAEELLFRGIVYRAIAQYWPDGRAVIVSALLFAVARFDVVLAPFFVAYGALLAILYRRTHQLLVPVGVRAIFDGTSYALLAWLSSAKP